MTPIFKLRRLRWLPLTSIVLGLLACVPPSPSRDARLAAGSSDDGLDEVGKLSEGELPLHGQAPAPPSTSHSELVLGATATPAPPAPLEPEAPQPPATLEQLALAVARGNYTAARDLLHAAPSSAVGSLIDGLVALEEENFDAARRALEQARQLEPALEGLLENLEHEASYRSEAALEQLDSLLRSRDFDLLVQLGERLLDAERIPDSRRFVARAAALARGSKQQGELRLLRAKLELTRDRPFAALKDLRWLAVSHPTHASAREATHLIETRFPRHPLSNKDRHARARAFAEAGDVVNLEIEVEALRRAQPPVLDEARLLSLKGNAHYAARQFESAAPLLQRAARLGGPSANEDWYYAGRAFVRIGRPELAIECFEQVLAKAPRSSTARLALFRVARQWSILGNWPKAIDIYSQFLKRYPANAYTQRAQLERAIAWLAIRDDARAAEWFKRLRARAPSSSEGRLLQVLEAGARLRMGQPELAVPLLEEVAEQSPLSFAGLAARKRLSALGKTAVHPALRRSAQLPPPPMLPHAAIELDLTGFSELSQELAREHEDAWADGASRCQAYSQLSAGRRRYLWGYREATRSGFFSDPSAKPDWQWQCLYPTPYRRWVDQYGQAYGVPSSMVYAVMRQESGFRAAVQSPAGAMGLMQIIDPTARRLVEELNLDYHPKKLEHPAYNVQLGTYYLSRLFEYFEHPALVAAAYNAGPDAAARWSAAGASLPLEAFVLRIPFDETRNYVQRVLANLETYEHVYPDIAGIEVEMSLGPQWTALVPPPARPLMAPASLY